MHFWKHSLEFSHNHLKNDLNDVISTKKLNWRDLLNLGVRQKKCKKMHFETNWRTYTHTSTSTWSTSYLLLNYGKFMHYCLNNRHLALALFTYNIIFIILYLMIHILGINLSCLFNILFPSALLTCITCTCIMSTNNVFLSSLHL